MENEEHDMDQVTPTPDSDELIPDCEEETPETPQEKRSAVVKEILSWIYTVVIPIAVILLLNAFVVKLVIVHGSSMYPTLHDLDLMIVRTIAYTPTDGDIVVITSDEDSALGGENIVKRVIATGGQTVSIDYDTNTVTVDGVALDETYINHGGTGGYPDEDEYDAMSELFSPITITVPEGYIFVMGDNRNHSMDSRDPNVGLISVDHVLGKTILTVPSGNFLSDETGYVS
jgi:signal peptidase I